MAWLALEFKMTTSAAGRLRRIGDLLSPRIFFFAIALFAVTALEPLSLGGMKVSYLWKVITIAAIAGLLLIQVAASPRIGRMFLPAPGLSIAWVAYCATPLVTGVLQGELWNGGFVTAQRSLPFLAIVAIVVNGGLGVGTLIRIYCSTSAAAVVTALPFALGLVTPLGDAYELGAIFGEEASGFIGPFQNPHAASLTYGLLAVAVLAAARNLQDDIHRVVCAVLLIALLVLVVATFARAGLLAFIVGSALVLAGPRDFKGAIKALVGILLLLAFLVVTADVWIDTAIGRRLAGLTVFSENVNLDVVSSGRLRLWLAAMVGFDGFGVTEKCFGVGLQGSLAVMRDNFGVALIPHSVLFNELLAYGLVGLGASLMLMWFLAAPSLRDARQFSFPMGAAMAAFALVQGLDYPVQLLLVALPTCLVPKWREAEI